MFCIKNLRYVTEYSWPISWSNICVFPLQHLVKSLCFDSFSDFLENRDIYTYSFRYFVPHNMVIFIQVFPGGQKLFLLDTPKKTKMLRFLIFIKSKNQIINSGEKVGDKDNGDKNVGLFLFSPKNMTRNIIIWVPEGSVMTR